MARSYRLRSADRGGDPSAPSGGGPAPPAPWLLYLGVALVVALVVVTYLALRQEWRQRIGQSRGQAIYELVQDTVPSRPTETPGVSAWLHLELKRYHDHIPDPAKARLYAEIVDWHDENSLPPFLADLRADLAAPAPPAPPTDAPEAMPAVELDHGTPGGGGDGGAAATLQFRVQSYLELHGRPLVLTRRRAIDSGEAAIAANRFVFAAAHHLLAADAAFRATLARRPLPAVPGNEGPRVVRLYAVSEDGTLLSDPIAPASADARQQRDAALGEGREFRKLPELPNFVPNEFIFRFDFTSPGWQSRAYYSGLYLDLGGQGVVATLLVPVRDAETGWAAVVCADLVFAIDWQDFAAHIEPPMVAEVVHLDTPAREPWRPWAAMASHTQPGVPVALRSAVTGLASGEERTGRTVNPFYLYHGSVESQGAVAALQVASTTWLVTLFPSTPSRFALLPAVLLGLLLAVLLVSFEASRRRTERAQRKAEREFEEKQNLLNTMQVPLMVVDPNTDELVFSNRAAASLGIVPGTRALDLVVDEPRAREHYARMQVADPLTRRAYGVPLRVRGEDGQPETRYAIIRSVAVTAPIEVLHADQRHRLGVLFMLEPEADLALWAADREESMRSDERRKLAGLLAHGVDSLARVLAHLLEETPEPGRAADLDLARWLAAYLERRVLATAWLLEHWAAIPPLPPDSSIEAAQAEATVATFREIFARVRDDARLRSRLHWDNGVLAERPAQGNEVLRAAIDWPEEYWFAAPLRGGFGFFLGEVLINAVRHGRPGSVPAMTITLDPVRRELLFEVANEVPRRASSDAGARGQESYGGRRILERLAELCEWQDLRFTRDDGTFRVTWRVPVSHRGDPRAAD
jgi:PAS domain-containing protein